MTDASRTVWDLWSREAGEIAEARLAGRKGAGAWPCLDLRPTGRRGPALAPLEGEWPDWPELERWVVGAGLDGRASRGLHAAFARWVTVLWATDGAESLAWLCDHELGGERTRRASFVGPSVSSLRESLCALLEPTEHRAPRAVQSARRAARPFAPDAADRRLDDLSGVPSGRVGEQALRLRDEVRRLFGADPDRRPPSATGAPFLLLVRR